MVAQVGFYSSMPDVLKAHTCSFLHEDDVTSLKLTNKPEKHFVEKKFSELSSIYRKFGKHFTYDDLSTTQKLELELFYFQDRPIWQRVCIVAVCIIFSPLILLYHSPKILKKTYTHILTPLGHKMADCAFFIHHNLIKPTAKFAYNHILSPVGRATHIVAKAVFVNLLINRVILPIGKAIKRVSIWTYHSILTPLGKGIRAIAKAIFVTLPSLINKHVVKPSIEIINKLIYWTFDNVIIPFTIQFVKGVDLSFDISANYIIKPLWNHVLSRVVNAIRRLSTGLLITLPRKIFEHILTPIGHGIENIVTATFQHIITPFANQLIKGLKFTFNQILIPIAKVIRIIAKGIFISFPVKIYHHILTPMWNGFTTVAKFGYDNVLAPIGNGLLFAGRITNNVIITPALQAIQFAARVLMNQVIVPITNGIQFGASVLNQTIIIPTGHIIVAIPTIIQRMFFS